jgi:hypothetical protein
VRAAVLGDGREGYGNNLLTGKDISFADTFSGRLSAAWDITDDIRWVVRGDYQHTTGDGIPISTVVAESVTPTFAANWRARLDPDGAGPLVGETPILDQTSIRRAKAICPITRLASPATSHGISKAAGRSS